MSEKGRIIAIKSEESRWGVRSHRYPGDSPLRPGECDKIERVMRHGQMALVPWYQIIRDGRVHTEINSSYVLEIRYE